MDSPTQAGGCRPLPLSVALAPLVGQPRGSGAEDVVVVVLLILFMTLQAVATLMRLSLVLAVEQRGPAV